MWPDDEHSSLMISVILNDCAYSDVIVNAYLLCVYIYFFLHNIVLRVRNKCIYKLWQIMHSTCYSKFVASFLHTSYIRRTKSKKKIVSRLVFALSIEARCSV